MKIYFKKNFKENLRNLLRRCGYIPRLDRSRRRIHYIRRLGSTLYPHFHIYAEEKENGLLLNLHLDQKRPSYTGFRAHSAEYESKVVKEEGMRIKEILENLE